VSVKSGKNKRPTARSLVAMNLRALRARENLTQEQLALAAQLNRSYVSQIEAEGRAVSIDVLDDLAKALSVPIGRFFEQE
jgi:transcriptional regulator with XRE-family HTH domain